MASQALTGRSRLTLCIETATLPVREGSEGKDTAGGTAERSAWTRPGTQIPGHS